MYKELANDILDKIIDKNIDCAEVYIISSKGTKIDILNQNIESIDDIASAGIGIRVFNKNQLGFAYCSDFDCDEIDTVINEAIYNSRDTQQDINNILPEPKKSDSKLHLCDDSIISTPLENKIQIAKQAESAAYSFDKRITKTEKVSYSDGEYHVVIANSNGIEVEYRGTSCGIFAEVIAGDGGQNEAGFGIDYCIYLKDINPKKTGFEAAARAVELLGAKTAKSGKMDIILEPHVSIQFLEIISHLVSADMVQKGKSLLSGKIGQSVASSNITIIDNGKLKNGVGSSPYDCEGVPTQETLVIDSGLLKSYLYNTYSASKGGTISTGNAARGSYKTPPGISSTNFYIKNGVSVQAEMIKSVKNGLIIKRVMGMHTINPISGDFSVGAAGILVENGQKSYPVRGLTIAGNLIEILKSIEEVGNDLRFIGSSGSPTLLVSNIAVSGS